MKIISKTESDTKKAASKLVEKLKGGQIVALYGQLGAGKTLFVKAMAKSFGIEENITSPTFVLMKVYPVAGKDIKNFVHVDCYRLDQAEDLSDIGLGDYLGRADSLVLIEWADKVKNLPKDKTVRVDIDYKSVNLREITIEP